jgi:hypothetical protein
MRKRIHFYALLAIAVVGMFTLSACSSGGGGGNHPTVNDIVVLPGSASVPVSQTAQFSAFLNGASTSATWTASGGTIDGSGVFTAPSSAGNVTITATSGSDTGTTTVNVVASQTLVVNPAALTISAGAMQSFTVTPSAVVAWSVNGVAFGDCVAPLVGSVTQCHGTIDGNGNYTAPLSPPTGGTVTIGAAVGGNSGTSTATVLYSAASLTTTTLGTGQYALAFSGIDFQNGFPVDVVGSIQTNSTLGTITGGEIDFNTGTFGTASTVPVTGGTFQVGPLDGRTSIVVTLATNSFAASLNLQATLATNQHALLIDFDAADTGSGTLDAQNLTSFGAGLTNRYSFSYFGLDQNLNPVTVAGTFLASNNSCLPINNANSPVNTQDFTYVPLNSNTLTVVTNDITLSGSCTNPDSTFGRGTITMNSDDLGTINFSYYMIDQTHLKLVEIDPAQPYVLYGEAYGSPLATTPLNGGVALTFGGAANNAPYAGGAVFAINGATINSGGALDINNSGGAGAQNNATITGGGYANVLTAANVPARFTLSLTTSKGTILFAAYTFVTPAATGAELVEIDTNNNVDGATGTAYQRGGVSTVQGSFALNLSGVGSSKNQAAFEQDIVGQLGLVNNSTTLTGTLDINNGGPISGLPVNSTSILNAATSNGRGTAQVNVSSSGVSAKFNLVYYQVDSNTALLLDADLNRVANGMLIRQF